MSAQSRYKEKSQKYLKKVKEWNEIEKVPELR